MGKEIQLTTIPIILLIPSFGVFSLLSFDDAFAWLGFNVK